MGLVLTLIIIFTTQGQPIIENPLHILLISVPLIIQNILISIIAGITLSDYVMNNGKKNDTAWLLIFGLLSVSQYFIVFVERYYLSGISPISFRPLAMILNASVYYVFYEFVMVIEKSNDN